MIVTIKTLQKHLPQFADGFYTHQKIDFEFAHEIIRLDHTGWYTNEFNDLRKGYIRAEIVGICEKLRDLRRKLKTDYAGVL